MRQDELGPARGSKHRKKRVGRGDGSGHGSYSTRGQKGQKARTGGGVSPRFEGGQTPLVKRLPQLRGFHNIFKVKYSVVNLKRLSIFKEGEQVTPELMVARGLVGSLDQPIKVLGDGELEHSLAVKAHKFSESARKKIEAMGGKAEEISK